MEQKCYEKEPKNAYCKTGKLLDDFLYRGETIGKKKGGKRIPPTMFG